jgi:two-component system, cell cycle sensor histidine kinase and response regulator CckA
MVITPSSSRQPSHPPGTPRILIVEDEQIVALNLSTTLAGLGYEIAGIAAGGDQAVQLAEETRPDLALMDIALSGRMDGIAVAREMRKRRQLPVVFLTAYTNDETVARARESGAFGYLTKPFRTSDLNATILVALNQHRISVDLLEERTWLTTLLASISDGVIATDREGRINFVNEQGEALTGWTRAEALGRRIDDVYSVEHGSGGAGAGACPIRAALRSGAAVPQRRGVLHARGGGELPVEDRVAPLLEEGHPVGAAIVFRDIRERLRLEEAEKLKTLGVLAGGVAHDFNNLLTAIIGNASLAIEHLPESSRTRSLLNNVVKTGTKAAELTGQLLAYAGKGQFVMRDVDLSDAVREILDLIQTTIPAGVFIELHLQTDLPPINADVTQIQQIVMNLVINAAEALAETGGVIRIAIAMREGGGSEPAVVLRVSDNGPGMDPATVSKIFDPFFTTKFTGRGLGLAAVRGIVRSHGGTIDVETKPASGTTFTLTFPCRRESLRRLTAEH